MLDHRARRVDGGRALVGGSPLRVLRLSPAGADLVDRLAAGAPVPRSGPAQALARRLVAAGLAHPQPRGPGEAPEPPAPGPGQAGALGAAGAAGPAGALGAADVTLVVPVRDRAGGLARTLATVGPVGAVVVVDDGSGPAQARALGRAVGGGRPGLVRHERSLGPAAARNTGWALAGTEVVAFVDADCEPEPGWLAPLLAHLADPEVGAVAPRVVAGRASGAPGAGGAGPGRRSTRLEAYERRRSPLDMGRWPAAVAPGCRIPYVPTAALVVRRQALEQAGGFDPSLRVGEDVDLVWRLAQAGWTIRYEPAARVVHPTRGGLGSWAYQRLAYGRSAAALHRRHHGRVPAMAAAPPSVAAWALVALGRPWAAMALAAAGTARLARRLRSLERPWWEAARLAGLAHVSAGSRLGEAVRRPWWPMALALALAAPSGRRRRAIVALGLLPPLWDWVQERPGLDPWTWLGLRLLDDVAYGAGVWIGCAEHATVGPLCPGRISGAGKFGDL